MKFKNLNLKDYILKSLDELKFIHLTEIQKEVIPRALNNQSLIGKSQTGTGKTHAFLIPILQNLDEDLNEVQALILSPTRELAQQLYDVTLNMTKHSTVNIDVRLYTGGTDRDSEIKRLSSSQPQIVIGTLGKIKDLVINENILKIYTAQTVVIDEADMVFESSEMVEIDQVFSVFKEELQILVFSATIPQNLVTFLNRYLQKIELIDITEKQISKATIHHVFIPTKNKDKNTILVDLLNAFEPFLALIFANTKTKVDEVSEYLASRGFKVAKITGDLQPRQRKQILKRIKDLEFQYVVASDLASRGIDILGVSHVINYELPNDIEFYVHRTGRTARHEFVGQAISFYDYEDDSYLNKLEDKGIKSTYMVLKDGVLVPTKERNARSKRQRPETNIEQQVHSKYPLPKKVKPGYRKKRKEQINKEIRKLKREKISEIYRRKARKK